MSGASIGISVQTALRSGLLCRVTGQARGCMAEDRAEAFCRGLGKTLFSSPDIGISLSTVSIYQHTLFYPNTCAEINSEDLIGLSAGQSLSIIIRQLTTGMFASDPKEGRVLFLSLLFSFLQVDAAAFVPGCCRGPGDAAWCGAAWEQENRRAWARQHVPLCLKPAWWALLLTPCCFSYQWKRDYWWDSQGWLEDWAI